MFIGRTDVEAETSILWPSDVKSWLFTWKGPWCWERLRAGGEGEDRGWDGWMASQTQWSWVWVDSESWWRTGRPGVLQSMGSQRVGHNWTELNWTEGFPGGPVVKSPPCNVGDTGLIHGPGRSHMLWGNYWSPCATTTEPMCCNYWSPHTTEPKPALPNKRGHVNKKPLP